jgi:hypothetical protein
VPIRHHVKASFAHNGFADVYTHTFYISTHKVNVRRERRHFYAAIYSQSAFCPRASRQANAKCTDFWRRGEREKEKDKARVAFVKFLTSFALE